MPDLSPPGRRCPACASVQPVLSGEPIWPLGRPCSACGHIVPQERGVAMFAPGLADTIDGFDPKSFDELSRLEDEHFWFVARNQLILGLMNKYFPEARRFMEIGCGTGFVLRAIAQSRKWDRIVGSELHPAGLEYAKRRLPPEVELIQMDARHIPAESLFDLTGAFDVVEHIADDEAVLRGMRASMLQGGGLIVTVPQHPWLWSRADEVACHQRRYRRGELETKLRRNGFNILFSSSFTALLLPLMAASRLRRSKKEEAYEFNLNSTVNKVLLKVLQSEVAMTLSGVRWAAGGSRVVVAQAI
jgi:SAM-dependent methyltransferase